MLSNSNIENQNIINSNNISGSSSGSLLCNSLTLTDENPTLSIQDTNNNSTIITPSSITTNSNSNSTIITPSSITTPSLYSLNTILGSLTVTGISNFINTLNINNTITLTDGTITNTLNKSDWTRTIKTVNTIANATHYLNFSDGAGTGQGNPQKNALLTCNPSTGNITATSFNGALFGTASNASNIALTSDNTSGTYFIPFSKTNTSSNVLYVDDVTGPLTYNPSTGAMSLGSITTTGGISGLLLIGELQTSGGASPAASFTASTLTINCNTVTLRTNAFTFTGASNTVSTLTINSPRNNGIYYVALQNNGTGNLTINTGLGANIKTTYSSAITVPTNGSALMQINLITLNSVNSTIVDVKVLT